MAKKTSASDFEKAFPRENGWKITQHPKGGNVVLVATVNDGTLNDATITVITQAATVPSAAAAMLALWNKATKGTK